MEQSSFVKIIRVLQVAYPYYFKDMSKETSVAFMQLYFSKLKKYDYKVVSTAIDNIITDNKYMPTLAEVIKECENQYKEYNIRRIQEMYKQGYFKTDEEYGKAMMWLLEEKPIIPNWLQEDMKKIGDIKLINTERIESNDTK